MIPYVEKKYKFVGIIIWFFATGFMSHVLYFCVKAFFPAERIVMRKEGKCQGQVDKANWTCVVKPRVLSCYGRDYTDGQKPIPFPRVENASDTRSA